LCLFVYFISTLFPSLSRVTAILLYGTVGVAALGLSLAAQVRRWHDLGKSGWGALLNLVPGLGTLISILMLAARPTVAGANQFGDSPKPGLLGHRQTWAFFFGKFFTDGVWWFYLFWLPDYLHKQFGMTKHEIMLPTFIVYGVAIVGSVYGGSLPMTLMKRGLPAHQARMTAMFIIALFPLTVLTTQYFANVQRFGHFAPAFAVAIISLGAAAHQAWSANLFTTVSDLFPKKSVGSVTGIGAMAGGLGGVIVLKLSGTLADAFKDNPQQAYLILFAVCALSYLTAWGLMKALVPRHQPIRDL
jgi:ACS family hexuronate transporter-like MFS transporter